MGRWDGGTRDAPARQRRKVIYEGRNLRIQGHDVTVRSNSSNSCLKSPQIGGQNLEPHGLFRTFAMSKDLMAQSGMSATRCSWSQRI